MVKECFRNNGGVQVSQGTAVPVKFLEGRDARFRDRYVLAFIVLTDPVMRFVVIILLQKDLLVPVQVFQCPYIF